MSVRKLVGLEHVLSEAYLTGVATPALAKAYSCSVPTVLAVLRQHGVAIRGIADAVRKYRHDGLFFDNIDNPDKAYVFGLMLGDGYNDQKNGVVRLALTDYDLVMDVAAIMKAEKPIYSRYPDVGKPFYELNIKCQRLSDALAKHGCPQRKTFITEFPLKKVISDNLIHHMVRGYFDADGCIHNRRDSKNMVVHILGTEAFLKGLELVLPFKTFVHQRTRSAIWYLGIYRLDDVHKFRAWIYEDATLFLARKWKIFHQDCAAA